MYLHDPFLSGCAEPMWPNDVVFGPNEDDDATWLEPLQDDLWRQVQAVYADSVQLNVLRALAIDGVPSGKWPTVFSQLICEEGEWPFIKLSWLEQRQIPDLDWFTRTVANSVSYCTWRMNYTSQPWPTPYPVGPLYDCCLPPIFPFWLLAYGYTQPHYIQDLNRYWSDIHPVYYQPWPGTRIGDISSISTVKQLGLQARREIGALFDLATAVVEPEEAQPDAES